MIAWRLNQEMVVCYAIVFQVRGKCRNLLSQTHNITLAGKTDAPGHGQKLKSGVQSGRGRVRHLRCQSSWRRKGGNRPSHDSL